MVLFGIIQFFRYNLAPLTKLFKKPLFITLLKINLGYFLTVIILRDVLIQHFCKANFLHSWC